jgi:hypothetical protein
MEKALAPFFKRSSYDLLRKNCNSFSDCALFCLLGVRLDSTYLGLDKLGVFAEQAGGVVQLFTQGRYKPNPKADGFSVDAALLKIAQSKGVADMYGSRDSKQRRRNRKLLEAEQGLSSMEAVAVAE